MKSRVHRSTVAQCFLLLLLTSLAHAESIRRPTDEEVRNLFLQAKSVPYEQRSDDVAVTLNGPTRVTYELGRWIPGEDDELLVTVTALVTGHVGGLYRCAFALMNLRTHELLTPVYSYVSDEAQQVTYHGKDQDFLLYVGASGGQGVRRDDSFLFQFRTGGITATSALGDLSPESHAVLLRDDKVVLLERVKAPVHPTAKGYRTLYYLHWNEEKRDFAREEVKDKFLLGLGDP